MSRFCGEHKVKAILSAAQRLKDQCLLTDGSLFSEESIWNLHGLNELDEYFIKKPDEGNDDFLTKLQHQLENTSPTTKKLAAEMRWVMLLFPTQLKPNTKRAQITAIYSWSGQNLSDDHPMLSDDVLNGVGSSGTAYLTGPWRELRYLIRVTTAYKKLSKDIKTTILGDPWAWSEWLGNAVQEDNRQLYHMLSFFFFPDFFERIASGGHKCRILETFLRLTQKDINVLSWTEVDQKIYQLRLDLLKEHNTDKLDFYQSPLREKWMPEKKTSTVGNDDYTQINASTWLYAPGEGAEYWEEFYSSGIMAIGWDELGDFRKYKDKEAIAKELRIQENDPDSSKKNNATSCFSFAYDIEKGDIVFAKAGRRRILGWGIVTSDYIFETNRQFFKHVRKIDWKAKGNWEVSEDNRFALKTLTNITIYTDFVSYLNNLVNRNILSVDEGTPRLSPDGVRYWWLNANPKIWNFVDTPIGGMQTYTTHNEKGNKRRVYKYFEEVKPGDILIGYISSPNKEIVAEAVITKGLHQSEDEGERIQFKKTESFIVPVTFEQLKGLSALKDAEPLVNNQGSLFKLSSEEYEIIRGLIDDANPPIQTQPASPEYPRKQAYSELFISPEIIDKAISLLSCKKNIVLQGPPGVGKTFFAKRLAYSALGRKDNSKIQMIQFHQSYSYEDFMQGYRPTPAGRFELKNGIFYMFCRQAQIDDNNNYFFIIDEINRGNLSKIFGELMMLIECDKRGREFALPLTYAQGLDDKFYIPENLHIIGTMNTADRSLAMVDYALRRRFCFMDLAPVFDEPKFHKHLGNAGADDKLIRNIVAKMNELNIRIEKDKNLGKGFKIGHSYFCPQKGVVADFNWFKNVVYSEIEPLLKEYWFDNPDEAQKSVERLLSE